MGISLQADCSYGPKICHRFSYNYNFYTRLRKYISNFGFATMELTYTTFWSHGRQQGVSCSPVSLVFTLSHLYCWVSFTRRDDQFENLGKTTVLACEMFTSGLRRWLKNVIGFSCLLDCSTNVIVAPRSQRSVVQAVAVQPWLNQYGN